MIYYPYLRGRMYDLLALKELVQTQQLSRQIVPIIEPVRDSKELLQTVETFIRFKQPFSVVANPQVSIYGLNTVKLYPLPELNSYDFYHPSAILEADFSSDFFDGSQNGLLLAPNYQILKDYQTDPVLQQVESIFIPNAARFRWLLSQEPVIEWTDSLTFMPHLSDYTLLCDEFFEMANWDYQIDGDQGFSDYSMIGSYYFDKGMPSRAIVIHLIYVTTDGSLRIHHFVSDSNESMKGQKQKFFEALVKLVAWSSQNLHGLNDTPALRALLAYQEQDKFPGLGVVKKLSLMHHFQLMSRLLNLKSKLEQ